MGALQRVVVTPPVAAPKLRLSILLKDEIAKQLVSVDETSNNSKVIFKGDSMFMVGSDNVRPEMIDVIKRVAQEVHRVKGAILIVGHTDSMPINKPGFPNNQVLSENARPMLHAIWSRPVFQPTKFGLRARGNATG